MDGIDDALERRVGELLGHLDAEPAVAAALPFTVDYLIGEIRRALPPELPPAIRRVRRRRLDLIGDRRQRDGPLHDAGLVAIAAI